MKKKRDDSLELLRIVSVRLVALTMRRNRLDRGR